MRVASYWADAMGSDWDDNGRLRLHTVCSGIANLPCKTELAYQHDRRYDAGHDRGKIDPCGLELVDGCVLRVGDQHCVDPVFQC